MFKESSQPNPGEKIPDSDRTKEISHLNSEPFRNNKRAVEYHVAGNLELFYENTEDALEGMFGTYPSLKIEDLSAEELADVENFIHYAAKRLAAGAVSSKIFHESVKAGNPLKALNVYNPATASQLGHDAIHAMFAYAQSEGASLVPAYMTVSTIETSRGVSAEDKANLEEHYVGAFTQPAIFLRPICQELIEQGLSGEDLVQALITRWDVEVAQRITSARIHVRNPNYVRENMLPEFLTVVRNYCQQMEKGHVNPKFSLNEFRRILQPLLKRLEKKQQDANDLNVIEAEDIRIPGILDRIKEL